MNDFKKLKDEYQNIRASDEFAARIAVELHRKKVFTALRKAVILVAALLAAFVLSVNLSPSFALSLSDLPFVGKFAKAVTVRNYEFEENTLYAKITVPQIENLGNPEAEKAINDQLRKDAEAKISQFEQEAKELKNVFGDGVGHYGVDSGYLVKTDNARILAIDVYTLTIVGSSSTVNDYYTFDKMTGELLTFESLFVPESGYAAIIDDYVLSEMIRRNQEDSGMYFTEDFNGISENQKFYINDDLDLVICFDKYEIAAGAQGSSEFVIPKELIASVMLWR